MSYREEKLKTVSVMDPAIDVKRMGLTLLNKFLVTRDIKLIEPFYIPGERPTIYHLREVPEYLWESFVQDGANDSDKHKRAFMCCLVTVENLHQPDGPSLEDVDLPRPGREVMSQETLVRFRAQYREEIGAVAYQHSFFDRRTLDCFLLPPSLGGPLEQRMRRLAASSPSSLTDHSSEASPESAAAQ